eukprot:TRINITY_DN42464_c0_g1_i1.p1 TRINITY_DN42464_c0_g1~~TRINITY_DN42464_c0_g1_i1.p1  ORF type:complete len:102 (+),score=32.38 TRINITY_DN42464_c0_g1_i1:144-449(+)
MIRRPPRSTLSSSSAASDVYKRQDEDDAVLHFAPDAVPDSNKGGSSPRSKSPQKAPMMSAGNTTVSYTHLRAHETPEHLVCRLLLEKKKKMNNKKYQNNQA